MAFQQFYYISSVGLSECGQILYFSIIVPAHHPTQVQQATLHPTAVRVLGAIEIRGFKLLFTMLDKWTAMFYYLQKSPSILPNTQDPASPYLQQGNQCPSIELHYSDIHPSFLLWSEGIPIRHALSDWGGIQKLIISTMARAHFISQDVFHILTIRERKKCTRSNRDTLPLTFWGGTLEKVRESKTSFTKPICTTLKCKKLNLQDLQGCIGIK